MVAVQRRSEKLLFAADKLRTGTYSRVDITRPFPFKRLIDLDDCTHRDAGDRTTKAAGEVDLDLGRANEKSWDD